MSSLLADSSSDSVSSFARSTGSDDTESDSELQYDDDIRKDTTTTSSEPPHSSRETRRRALRLLFRNLDGDDSGAIDGNEILSRMGLFDLGPLRQAGARITAMVHDGMMEAEFVEVFDNRLPDDPVIFGQLLDEFMAVAAKVGAIDVDAMGDPDDTADDGTNAGGEDEEHVKDDVPLQLLGNDSSHSDALHEEIAHLPQFQDDAGAVNAVSEGAPRNAHRGTAEEESAMAAIAEAGGAVSSLPTGVSAGLITAETDPMQLHDDYAQEELDATGNNAAQDVELQRLIEEDEARVAQEQLRFHEGMEEMEVLEAQRDQQNTEALEKEKQRSHRFREARRHSQSYEPSHSGLEPPGRSSDLSAGTPQTEAGEPDPYESGVVAPLDAASNIDHRLHNVDDRPIMSDDLRSTGNSTSRDPSLAGSIALVEYAGAAVDRYVASEHEAAIRERHEQDAAIQLQRVARGKLARNQVKLTQKQRNVKRSFLEMHAPAEGLTIDERRRRYSWLVEIQNALQQAGGSGITREIFLVALRALLDATAHEYSAEMEDGLWGKIADGREQLTGEQGNFVLEFGRIMPAGAIEFNVATSAVLTAAQELWTERIAREDLEEERRTLEASFERTDAAVRQHEAKMHLMLDAQREVIRAAELKRRMEAVAAVEAELEGRSQSVRVRMIRGIFASLGGTISGVVFERDLEALGLLAAMQRHGSDKEVDEAEFVSLMDGILPDSVSAAEAMAAHLTRNAADRRLRHALHGEDPEVLPPPVLPTAVNVPAASPVLSLNTPTPMVVSARNIDSTSAAHVVEDHEENNEDDEEDEEDEEEPLQLFKNHSYSDALRSEIARHPHHSSSAVEPQSVITVPPSPPSSVPVAYPAIQQAPAPQAAQSAKSSLTEISDPQVLSSVGPSSSSGKGGDDAKQALANEIRLKGGDVVRRLESRIEHLAGEVLEYHDPQCSCPACGLLHGSLELEWNPAPLIEAIDTVGAVKSDHTTIDRGGHLSVLEKMRAAREDAEIQTKCLKRLIELARIDSAHQNAIVSDEGHRHALQALRDHPQGITVQLAAVGALQAMTSGSDHARQTMCNDGTQKDLALHLHHVLHAPQVVQHLSGVLLELTLGEGSDTFAQDCTLQDCLAVMREYPQSARIAQDGCRHLARLAMHGACGAAVAHGAVSVILAAMNKHTAEAKVQLEGARVLELLSCDDSSEAVLAEAEAHTSLVAVLQNHSHADVVEAACSALATCSVTSVGHYAALEAEAPVAVLKVMSELPGVARHAQLAAAEAILTFLADSPKAFQVIVAAAGVSTVSRAMTTQWSAGASTDATSASSAEAQELHRAGSVLFHLEILSTLLSEQTHHTEALKEDVLSVVAGVLSQQSDHVEGTAAACSLLGNLVHSAEGEAQVSDCMAAMFPALIGVARKALRDADTSELGKARRVASWEALTNLCYSAPGAQHGIKEMAHLLAAEALPRVEDSDEHSKRRIHEELSVPATGLLRNLCVHCAAAVLAQDNGEVVRIMVDLLTIHRSTEPIVAAAVVGIKSLAQQPSGPDLLLEAQAAEKMVTVLHSGTTSNVLLCILQALTVLSANSSAALAIDRAGGLPVLVQTLNKEQDGQEVLKYACAVVGNLLNSAPGLRGPLVQLKAPTAALRWLRDSGSFELSWHALVCVAQFVNTPGSHIEVMLDRELAAALVDTMRKYYDCHELQMVGLRTFLALAEGSHRPAALQLTKAGAHTAVMAVMGANREKPDVQSTVCQVVTQLAKHDAPTLVKDRVHVVVAQAHRGRKDHPHLQACAQAALSTLVAAGDDLSKDPPAYTEAGGHIRRVIGQEGLCVAAVVSGLAAGGIEEVMRAVEALAALAHDSREGREEIFRAGGQHTLLNAMQTYKSHLPMQHGRCLPPLRFIHYHYHHGGSLTKRACSCRLLSSLAREKCGWEQLEEVHF